MIKLKTLIKEEMDIATIDKQYPVCGDEVNGLKVGDDIANTSSIRASFHKYFILENVREVSLSEFSDPSKAFYAVNDIERCKQLAEEIRQSKVINPLIVAIDDKGPYILEGAHRWVALSILDVKSLPALIVVDLD